MYKSRSICILIVKSFFFVCEKSLFLYKFGILRGADLMKAVREVRNPLFHQQNAFIFLDVLKYIKQTLNGDEQLRKIQDPRLEIS